MFASKLHKSIMFFYVLLLLMLLNIILNAQQNIKNSAEENYLTEAQNFYENVLEDDSTNYDALTNLGVIYQQKGDLEKSLRFFKNAVEFHPQKARAFHNLGILYSLMNRLDDAVINLNKAAELDVTNPNSVRQLGIIYMQNEKYKEAIESFNRALSRDKRDTESYLGKSLAYWLLKEYNNVLTTLSDMQSFNLKFNRMELLLADVYFKKNEFEKAMKYAKVDEKDNSSEAEGHYLLGQLYNIIGEKYKAEFEFKEAGLIVKQNANASVKLTVNVFFNSASSNTWSD